MLMALDQATASFLGQMAEQGGKPLHEMDPVEARQLGGLLTELSGPGPEVAKVENHSLATDDGGEFDVRVLAPEDPRAVIVYYHGGGWVIGDIDQFDNLGRQLANRTGAAVVLVNYRKAPEHRYPAAVEDSWQALNWVDENIETIAGKRVPLIVAGDSAGGNLSAIMSQRSRDRSGPTIDLQVLIYPVTDHDLATSSYLAPENQLMLSKDTMIWFFDHYIDEARRDEPDASPLRASDLAGLPPAVVLTAEHDVLRSEGEAYAAALETAGVPVTKEMFAGQMHGFFTMVNILPGSAAGIDYVVDAVDRALTQQPAST
jgi:acetyl esterase